MSTSEASFHQAMLDGYHKLANLGYRPIYFLQMVQEYGSVQAARQLINQENTSEGFTRMWMMGRLDLSAEALVLKPEYRELFTVEERQRARQNLIDMGYRAPWDDEAA
jgi:hypothetical protein